MGTQNAAEQTIDSLQGEERGISSVNDTGPSTTKRGLIAMVILLILCAAGSIGYWKYKKNEEKASQSAAQKKAQISSTVPTRTFTEPPAPTAQASAATDAPNAVPNSTTGEAPPVPGDQSWSNGQSTPTLDKSGSALMAGSSKTNMDNSDNNQAKLGASNSSDFGSSTEMTDSLTSTRTATRKASMIGNRNFILAKGSFIDCALQTRLDSTVPGMTACVITRNIYSDNGKVLLIERGSTVTGEYKANMRQGMARIFVLWNRIKTPNGVVIPLDSPGTDQLGGGGVPGYIDNHFWQRFGGALLLSLVDDIAEGVTSNTGNGNNQFNFNSTGDTTQDMAAEALKNTINIPPTLYKNQGEQVGIYVARDLDFSSVYDVDAQ